MSGRVCPPFIGYILLNPLRRLIENPETMLGGFVHQGMTVLEPGCAMGYFTLPLARMVGPAGRVVAVDIQPKMLSALSRRARKAGLVGRIDIRQGGPGGMGLADLAGKVDRVAAIHVVHEVPEPARFFEEVTAVMKPGAKILIIEPKGHVSAARFRETAALAEAAGLAAVEDFLDIRARRALLRKP